jgi:hypothetical protein
LIKYKSPGIAQILAELIQTVHETLHSELHKLFNSIWTKEELPQQWKEAITAPTYKWETKQSVRIIKAFRHYQLYTKLYQILLSLSPNVHKIIGDGQWGLLCNILTTHIFCIHHILRRKMGVQ